MFPSKLCWIIKKGMFLYSAVSSPLDRSNRFTHFALPGRPVHSGTTRLLCDYVYNIYVCIGAFVQNLAENRGDGKPCCVTVIFTFVSSYYPHLLEWYISENKPKKEMIQILVKRGFDSDPIKAWKEAQQKLEVMRHPLMELVSTLRSKILLYHTFWCMCGNSIE